MTPKPKTVKRSKWLQGYAEETIFLMGYNKAKEECREMMKRSLPYKSKKKKK
jgi:hypothetical protein